ncbi:unnamed protein product, partial [marine sediment metagenome]
LKLVEPTKKGKEALADMGLTLQDVAPEGKTFSQIIGTLEDSQISLNQAVNLFGVRAGPLMMTVINQGQEAFDGLLTSVTGTTAGIDAVEVKMQSWSVVVSNLEGSMSLFKKTIGEDLLQAVIDTVGVTEKDGIRSMITYLTELEKEQGRIGGPLVALWENMSDAIKKVFVEEFGNMENFYAFLGDSMDVISRMSQIFLTFGLEGGRILIGFMQSTADWNNNLGAVATTIQTLTTNINFKLCLRREFFVLSSMMSWLLLRAKSSLSL